MQGHFQQFVCGWVLAACLAGSAGAADGQSTRYQRTVADFHRLDEDAQERWLIDLYRQRGEPATRAALRGPDLQKQIERNQAVLARVHRGGKLTDEGLTKVLADVDQLETRAIERLSQEYRTITARVLAADQTEQARRLELLRQIETNWQNTGRPWNQQPEFMRWLQLAIKQQKISPHPPLPSAPVFRAADPTALVSQPARRPASTPAPRATPAPARPAERAPAVASRPVDRAATRGSVMELPSDTENVTPRPSRSAARPATPTTEDAAKQAVRVARAEPTTPEVAAPELPAPRPNPVAPRTPAPARSNTVQTPPRPPATSKTAAPTTGARVNTQEFEARVSGYNLALADLVSRLHSQQQWTADDLTKTADSLNDLANTRTDLQVYANLVPADARRGLKPIEPLAPAAALVAAKIADARKQLESSIQGDATIDQTRELYGLDRASRRLAQLALPQ